MFLIIFGISTPAKFVSFRIAIFNSTVVDYLAISFRTLSHYPAQTHRSALDTLSYALACFTLSCFTVEFCYMGWVSNYLEGGDTKKMSVVEKNMREVMFDGLNPESINKNWFVRNYNLLYLLRFFVFMSFLFGLQYLQIFQALFSFILMISFTVLIIYYQLTIGIFDTFGNSIIKVIQECSIAVIMVLVNTFCVDSFKGMLNSKAKTIMVLIFMVLLLLNIVLEVLSVGFSVVLLCVGSKKVKPESIIPKNDIGHVLDMELPPNREKIKGNIKKRRNNRRKNRRKNRINKKKKMILDDLEGFVKDREEIRLMPQRRGRGNATRGILLNQRNPKYNNLMSKKSKTGRWRRRK